MWGAWVRLLSFSSISPWYNLAVATSRDILRFKKIVQTHARRHTRQLPWRSRVSEYRIAVSEIMLQQTPVDRVIPYYERFIRKFPSWKHLAEASFLEVFREWQGLGYNRRAKALRDLAGIVIKNYHGKLPRRIEDLVALPGIGPYTAGAILTFAHNRREVFIETNIRTVYLHHFFPGHHKVSDQRLLPLIEATLPRKEYSSWYAALMDYGAHLKRQGLKQNKRNPSYVTQKKFKGSSRELRGKILREISRKALSVSQLSQKLAVPEIRVRTEVERLRREELVRKTKGRISLIP